MLRAQTIRYLTILLLASTILATANTRRRDTRCASKSNESICGWELMELGVPISFLGYMYAKQTRDRSQCVKDEEEGKEYCTCVFECGNGVWTCEDGRYRFVQGCGKYCHAGECDGQGA